METQAQGVVVLQQGVQSLLQQRCLQTLRRFEQQGLVPVITLRYGCFKEPVLDRRQADLAGEYPLFSEGLFGKGGDTRQRLHGLMLKQITRAEMDTQLACAADHLN